MSIIKVDYGTISGGGGIADTTITSSSITYTDNVSNSNSIIYGEFTPSADIQANTTFATVSPTPKTTATGEAWRKNDYTIRRTITVDTSGNMTSSGSMGSAYTWGIFVLYES